MEQAVGQWLQHGHSRGLHGVVTVNTGKFPNPNLSCSTWLSVAWVFFIYILAYIYSFDLTQSLSHSLTHSLLHWRFDSLVNQSTCRCCLLSWMCCKRARCAECGCERVDASVSVCRLSVPMYIQYCVYIYASLPMSSAYVLCPSLCMSFCLCLRVCVSSRVYVHLYVSVLMS